MKTYGIIGFPLSHSYSQKYFTNFFSENGIRDCRFRIFEIESIGMLRGILCKYTDLRGFNVTTPYKKQVIPFLTNLHHPADEINSVNTVLVKRNNGSIELIGYNTDYSGFLASISDLDHTFQKALILGTGGAARAAGYALSIRKIPYKYISRKPSKRDQIGYNKFSKELVTKHSLIINATPLGMFPEIDTAPEFPYHFLTEKHLCYDLIYNPETTKFLRLCRKQGSRIMNGEKMFLNQAKESWRIWSNKENA